MIPGVHLVVKPWTTRCAFAFLFPEHFWYVGEEMGEKRVQISLVDRRGEATRALPPIDACMETDVSLAIMGGIP